MLLEAFSNSVQCKPYHMNIIIYVSVCPDAMFLFVLMCCEQKSSNCKILKEPTNSSNRMISVEFMTDMMLCICMFESFKSNYLNGVKITMKSY